MLELVITKKNLYTEIMRNHILIILVAKYTTEIYIFEIDKQLFRTIISIKDTVPWKQIKHKFIHIQMLEF